MSITTLIVCVRRKPDMSREDFTRYYRDVHGPLILSATGFSRHLVNYVQHHAVGGSNPIAELFGASGDYDAVAVLTFHSAEAMKGAFEEPDYLNIVRLDEPNFVDVENCLSFVTEPMIVKAAGGALFSLAGKTAVVTGGNKGVGAMITDALIDAGAEVLVVARGGSETEQFVNEAGRRGRCSLLAHDLSSMTGVSTAAAAIRERASRVDILVNNAGSFTAASVEALTVEQWDREIALNLRAPFFLVQSLLTELKAAARPGDPARVINVGSIAALWAKSSMAYAYSASKGGLHQLTRTLASDLTRQGINVNAIAPGFFPSDMTSGFFEAVPGLREQMIEGIPVQRLGTGDDVGGTAVYLASRAGAYVSGAILPVEGGLWSA